MDSMMIIRKLLLSSLLTLLGLLTLEAQQNIHVYGTVADGNGAGQQDVNLNVTAFFADSTVFFEMAVTDAGGDYEVYIPYPDPNILGFIQVDMVDCDNNIQTLIFTTLNGPYEFEADFTYCQINNPDSCVMFIVVENNPGTNQTLLTAWTPPAQNVEFLWNTGETTQTIVATQAWTYCVTATFANSGCTVTDCETVNPDSNSFCFAYIISTPNGDSTYNLEVIASGVAPFQYAWITGENTPYLYNVPPGTYCVVVTDATGCVYTTCIIVNDVNFCEAYIAEDPNGGLTAYGFGNPPISYLWSTGDTTQTIYPNQMGFYCVTVTDANGCVASACYDYWWNMDSCFVYVYGYLQDSSTFVLEAIPSGFGITYQYQWSTGETTPVIYPADPFGTYCVTVTDDTGCVATGCYDPNNWCYVWVDVQYIDTTTAILSAYNDPIFNWPGSPAPVYLWSTGETTPTITVDTSGAYCVTVTLGSGCTVEGCAWVDFEGLSNQCSAWVVTYPDSTGEQWYAEAYAWGFGSFNYQWSTGDTTNVIPISSPYEYVCVTVTSSLGCACYACVDTLFNPCQPYISYAYLSDSVAILTASLWNDPSQNATYVWSNGATGSEITVTTDGTYCVTATGGGCTGIACIDVFFGNIKNCGVWISEEPVPAGTMYTANAWGTPPFVYQWDNGSTEQSIIIDFGLPEHCVTVTDAAGCVATACNFILDSCYAEIALNFTPDPQLAIFSWDPITFVQWSTGPGDTMLWLDINQPGTYCATYTTLNGCVNTTCITVDSLSPNSGFNIISGYVIGDTLSSLKGIVTAYLINNNTGEIFAEAGSSPIGQDGFYSIGNLAPGIYILKASLDANTPGAERYIPTYHLSSDTWDHADPYVIPNWLPVTTDIWLIRKAGLTGGGVIGGLITDPQHLVAEEDGEQRNGGGLANVVVLLHDVNGLPLDYEVSLEDGSFRFTELPYGTYRVSFDIPGIISPDVWVTLTAQNPEILNVNLTAGTVAVDDPRSEEIRLYPNPAAHRIHMAVPGENQPYEIQVTDMQGKMVFAGSARNVNGILSIDVSTFANGLYQVNLLREDRLFYGRFIKQE